MVELTKAELTKVSLTKVELTKLDSLYRLSSPCCYGTNKWHAIMQVSPACN